MFNKILFALALVVVATVSALGTRLVIAAQAGQQDVDVSAKQDRVAPADCEAATWPDIPAHCFKGATTRKLRIVVATSADYSRWPIQSSR